jgi:hypothetical protein
MGYNGSYFMMSGFDYLIRMQEANILSRILGGSLTYRITGLPDGKKLIHLMNTPGGKFNWSSYNQYEGKAVWYWYYDVEPDSRADCLKNNPDIIKLPTDVPIEELTWTDLNVPGQQWVRRWFTAYCKETLARVRGKYSGNLKTPDSEITMDYQSLLTEAKDEKSKLIEELIGAEGWLTRMRPDKVMEREALIAENLNKQMKFRAMPRQIYVIIMAVIKTIPVRKFINGQQIETSEISLVSELDYRTNGEDCCIIRGIAQSYVTLDSRTTDHVTVKAMTHLTIRPDW